MHERIKHYQGLTVSAAGVLLMALLMLITGGCDTSMRNQTDTPSSKPASPVATVGVLSPNSPVLVTSSAPGTGTLESAQSTATSVDLDSLLRTELAPPVDLTDLPTGWLIPPEEIPPGDYVVVVEHPGTELALINVATRDAYVVFRNENYIWSADTDTEFKRLIHGVGVVGVDAFRILDFESGETREVPILNTGILSIQWVNAETLLVSGNIDDDTSITGRTPEQVFFIDLTTGDPTPVSSLPASEFVTRQASLSYAGAFMAVSHRDGISGESGVTVYDQACLRADVSGTSCSIEISVPNGQDSIIQSGYAAWHPFENRLAFACSRDSTATTGNGGFEWGICIESFPSDGTTQVLTRVNSGLWSLKWSPDGRFIAYSLHQYDIMLVEVETGGVSTLRRSDQDTLYPLLVGWLRITD